MILITNRYRFLWGWWQRWLVIACLCQGLDAQNAEERFAYSNAANLVGQSGGSGWLSNWLAIGSPTPVSSPVITSSGLSYPGYVSAGGALRDNGGSFAATRQWFTPASGFVNGAVVWFSCLIRATNTSTSDTLVLPFGDKGSSTSGHGIALATKAAANSSSSSADTYIFLRHGSTLYGTDASTSGPGLLACLGISKTILVVGRFTLSTTPNADALDVWVNQTTEPTGNAPLRRSGFTATRSTSSSDGRALLYFGSAAQSMMDEFRIGTTYAAVTSGLNLSTPPLISVDSPMENQLFASPATIAITANVTPGNATIKKVQFYNGATLLGEDLTAPYSYNWINVPVSKPKLTARVVYDLAVGQNADFVQQSSTRTVYVLDNSPVTFSIDAQSNRRPISPLIYGTNNLADPASLRELNYTINRRGGEVESRYDYKTNSHNICQNWYYTSSAGGGAAGSGTDTYVRASKDARADVIVAIPTIGWMPKPNTYSFSQSKYGLQTANEPYGLPDAGSGTLVLDSTGNPIPYRASTAAAERAANVANPTVSLTPNHADPRFRSDPNDANYFPANAVAYQSGYVDHLISTWGDSRHGGVRYYALDNEPKLWDSTHRDVRGGAEPSREEIRDYVISYSTMIKDRDPTAIVMAADEWGWLDWKNYYPWLLAQMQANHNATNRRLLDVLTLHYYANIAGTEGSLERIFSLNQSTRSLWDPAWVDQSWINAVINLIPNMRAWVAANYPGTKIGITEYNWGSENTIAGAVIQAEVLGIFGREGLDLATRWGSAANSPTNLTYKAMKMYRNYDNRRSAFGDTSVLSSTSANPDEINAFAAERSSDGALTIMALNKQPIGSRTTNLALANFSHRGVAQAWRLDATGVITRQADLFLTANSFSTELPPQSITLFVIPAAADFIANQAANPVPADSATFISPKVTLSWGAVEHASLYHVYLGTSAAAVATASIGAPEYRGASATPDFDLAGLSGTTTYYWRVDAEATGGTTTGTVWSFTTGIPPRGVVTLKNGDAFGSSSYNSSLNWSNAAAPSLANDYFTTNKELRSPTPTNGGSGVTTFGGYSLSLDAGGKLITKGANDNVLVIDRLFLNGGSIRVGDDGTRVTIAGSTAQVDAASVLDADKSTRTMVFAAPLSGTGRLSIASGSGAGGVVCLTRDNAAFTGGWTINSGATLQLGDGGFTGSLGSGEIVLNGSLVIDRSGQLSIPARISGSGYLTVNDAATLTLTGASDFSGATNLNAGSLLINGDFSASPIRVSSGASLAGNGVAGDVIIAAGASVAPGADDVGTFSVANADLGGELVIDINNAMGADQLNVRGRVTLAGTLRVQSSTGMPPNSAFVIVNHAGVGAVNGHFTGLPEGAVLPLMDRGWKISYVGGDGNDVTLTALSHYETWRYEHFGHIESSGFAANDVDLNFDGENNLLEFASGQNPRSFTTLEATLQKVGERLEFTYTRSKAALADGFVFAVESSDSLSGWLWSVSGITQEVIENNEVRQTIKATMSAGNGRKFVRLRVTNP